MVPSDAASFFPSNLFFFFFNRKRQKRRPELSHPSPPIRYDPDTPSNRTNKICISPWRCWRNPLPHVFIYGVLAISKKQTLHPKPKNVSGYPLFYWKVRAGTEETRRYWISSSCILPVSPRHGSCSLFLRPFIAVSEKPVHKAAL